MVMPRWQTGRSIKPFNWGTRDIHCLALKGRVLFASGKYAAAEKLTQKLISVAPQHPDVISLGCVGGTQRVGDDAEALAAYRSTFEKTPSRGKSRATRVRISSSKGDLAGDRAHFKMDEATSRRSSDETGARLNPCTDG